MSVKVCAKGPQPSGRKVGVVAHYMSRRKKNTNTGVKIGNELEIGGAGRGSFHLFSRKE